MPTTPSPTPTTIEGVSTTTTTTTTTTLRTTTTLKTTDATQTQTRTTERTETTTTEQEGKEEEGEEEGKREGEIDDDGDVPTVEGAKFNGEICDLPIVAGPCKAFFKNFGFQNGECTEFIYGGCQGNANRFTTLEECEEVCLGLGVSSEGESEDDPTEGTAAIISMSGTMILIAMILLF